MAYLLRGLHFSVCVPVRPPLQPGVLSLRKSPNRFSVKSGAGCRPSICGWRSSCGGRCLLTGCTLKPPRESPKKNSMLCCLTGRPGVTTRTRMKKKHIVVQQTKKSKHGGSNVRTGWHTSKHGGSNVRTGWHTSKNTARLCFRLQKPSEGTIRKGSLHLWSIVQKGGRHEKAPINSSDVD